MGRNMTLKECKDATLKLINQYSIAGGVVALSYNNQADYIARIVPLINDAQMEIAKTVRRIPAEYVITQAAVPNRLRGPGVDTLLFHGNDDVYTKESDKPCRSYYFEVDGDAIIEIEELISGKWSVVAVHPCNPKLEGYSVMGGTHWEDVAHLEHTQLDGGFYAYRGMAGSGSGKLRFRLRGDYPYQMRNAAFYEYSFASAEKVPSFGEYMIYEMPDDYYQLDGRGIPFYRHHRHNTFVMSHDFRWHGDKTLLLRRELKGEFIVDYFRYPKRIDVNAPDDTELDNCPDTHEAIPYLVGSMLVSQDNPALSSTLYNIFETRISRMNEATYSENMEVEDMYGFNIGMR